ncbi:MAG: slipin family protein [Okeania sp. SIO2G4]|uniref:slipin family protein n=2 Tax=Okeania TaxID=1458928 RepID=UPI0013BE1E0A|nr:MULTISPECIES: slipin family protein [unclassified Okeania]NEP40752.1 slipin family protein [Okeania sp. SIO2H7]NEP74611.1 slipin family protein [Okeania sp. SIO2G5]NEP95692.1 slipin family protein [Okeania sp. SIO2F5]NEQ93444.1 slipin family protein [Okeania sp. SIO2G4]
MLTILPLLILILIALLSASLKMNFEYHKSVIFRLGRFSYVRGPGVYLTIPIIDQIKQVDRRTITVDIESQDTVTKDSVTVGINAVLYYRIRDPEKALIRVKDYNFATSQAALTTLRNIIGQHKLDELLQERDKINSRICEIVDEITNPWGIEIERIEIKNMQIPKPMQRAMAKEAEVAREKRARMIKAESDYESTIKLTQAAREIAKFPVALELRIIQMIAEIGTEQNTTTILMIPSDILSLAKDVSQSISKDK